MLSDRGVRDERPRALSNHVVSRMYRPPDIILLEKHYDAAIDIWSAGCIFAELLICVQADKKLTPKEKVLFPGMSCYPLSPDTKLNNNNDNGELRISHKDLLKCICRIVGTPKECDKSFITDELTI